MAGKDVFIVGPGFIGWPLLVSLVNEGYNVTAMVRRKEHGDAIEKSGAKAVYGQLSDKKFIAKHTTENDIVIHTATADDLPSAEAVIDGVRKRVAEGKEIIYIHTSGTSVLDDRSQGNHTTEQVFTDASPGPIDALADDAPHRPVDLAIVKAARQLGDKAKIAIMIPPLIYGYNASNQRLTIQIPTLTRFALKHGFSGYIGKGLSQESQIHVNDLVRGYVVLLHAIERSPPSFVNDNPYFFCENGKEFSWQEVAEEVGKGLHAAGKLQDPTPRTVPPELYNDLFGPYTDAVIGLNSRSRAERLRQLGWKPVEKSLWESYIEDELPEILKEDGTGFDGYKVAISIPK